MRTSPDFTAVPVALGARSYDILVGRDLLPELGAQMAARLRSRRAVILTDQTVAGHYLRRVEESLITAGFQCQPSLVLPPGESTKSFTKLEEGLETLLGYGIERSTLLVALGGGVVGDFTGFLAAIALRGLDFVQVPTTLLAQVDSSVGGKTGINSRHGKNLIGAFHQPKLVLVDTGTLATLSERDRRAGYAEVVKYGLINDPAFFTWLEQHGTTVLSGKDAAAEAHAVTVSCRAKAAIVGVDERENGDRALLNLGHTFGHAFEAACAYDERLRHGEAVALGMVLAAEVSQRLGVCPAEDVARIRAHLMTVGLPTSATDIAGLATTTDALLAHMGHDKKVQNGRLTFILMRGIGQAFITRDVPVEVLRAVLTVG